MRAREAKMTTTKCRKRAAYRDVRLGRGDYLAFDAEDHREGWTVMSCGRYTGDYVQALRDTPHGQDAPRALLQRDQARARP